LRQSLAIGFDKNKIPVFSKKTGIFHCVQSIGARRDASNTDFVRSSFNVSAIAMPSSIGCIKVHQTEKTEMRQWLQNQS
jgi:hypothetical protein